MKIAVIGGGPAGLYFARLMKRRRPDVVVRVFEQNPPDATWGFGVGLGGRSMREIAALDTEVHDRMVAGMVFGQSQNIHLDGAQLTLEYGETMGAIERLALLNILAAACKECGVEIDHEQRIDDPAELAGYDLIVGADGINSVARRARDADFATRTMELTNHFAWYGVGVPLRPSALVFRSDGDSKFCGHYYTYTPEMSTFVAECDDQTWRSSGFDGMTDAARKREIERIFAPELGGAPLIENRSVWRQFPVIETERWFVDNVVLIGDSLRSAHFSIGSGTRLAMEDAAALFTALDETNCEVADALPRFVALRQPGRDMFSDAARRSFEWYEDMRQHMEEPLLDFIYSFLTRTGRITEARLASYAPNFFAAWRESNDGQAAARVAN